MRGGRYGKICGRNRAAVHPASERVINTEVGINLRRSRSRNDRCYQAFGLRTTRGPGLRSLSDATRARVRSHVFRIWTAGAILAAYVYSWFYVPELLTWWKRTTEATIETRVGPAVSLGRPDRGHNWKFWPLGAGHAGDHRVPDPDLGRDGGGAPCVCASPTGFRIVAGSSSRRRPAASR